MQITIDIPTIDGEESIDLDANFYDGDAGTPPISWREAIAAEVMMSLNQNTMLARHAIWVPHASYISVGYDESPDETLSEVEVLTQVNANVRYCLSWVGLDQTLRAVGAIATEMNKEIREEQYANGFAAGSKHNPAAPPF